MPFFWSPILVLRVEFDEKQIGPVPAFYKCKECRADLPLLQPWLWLNGGRLAGIKAGSWEDVYPALVSNQESGVALALGAAKFVNTVNGVMDAIEPVFASRLTGKAGADRKIPAAGCPESSTVIEQAIGNSQPRRVSPPRGSSCTNESLRIRCELQCHDQSRARHLLVGQQPEYGEAGKHQGSSGVDQGFHRIILSIRHL